MLVFFCYGNRNRVQPDPADRPALPAPKSWGPPDATGNAGHHGNNAVNNVPSSIQEAPAANIRRLD